MRSGHKSSRRADACRLDRRRPPLRHRRAIARANGQRGATSLELALLTPVLLFVILLVVQFAMVYHARHIALAAAQAGARVARGQVTGDWQGAARSKAESYAQQIGPNILTGVVATPSGGADERFVDVEGQAITVIPFMSLRVHQRAGGPTECFRPDENGGVSCEPQQ